MSRIVALAAREWRAYFLAPTGYIIIALFSLVSGIIFIVRSFDQGQPASMRSVFELGTWMLMFICPAISMRAISEEKRLGTFEMLMTCPVSESQVILAKFVAAFLFMLVMLASTLLFIVPLEWHGRPDYGELFCGYLGMALLGAAYLATGILASTLTTSQVVAFLATLFFWIGLAIAAKFLPLYVTEPWSSAIHASDPDPRMRDFAIGLIDTSNIAYFLSFTVLFLIAAAQVLQARRWA